MRIALARLVAVSAKCPHEPSYSFTFDGVEKRQLSTTAPEPRPVNLTAVARMHGLPFDELWTLVDRGMLPTAVSLGKNGPVYFHPEKVPSRARLLRLLARLERPASTVA
jgi:hypothetical protein